MLLYKNKLDVNLSLPQKLTMFPAAVLSQSHSCLLAQLQIKALPPPSANLRVFLILQIICFGSIRSGTKVLGKYHPFDFSLICVLRYKSVPLITNPCFMECSRYQYCQGERSSHRSKKKKNQPQSSLMKHILWNRYTTIVSKELYILYNIGIYRLLL